MPTAVSGSFNALPQPSACRLIDFDDVQVTPGTILRTYFLIVKGTKPWVTMDVGLHPLLYATRPDYTAIEVVGCQNGIGLPQPAPYSAAIEITPWRDSSSQTKPIRRMLSRSAGSSAQG